MACGIRDGHRGDHKNWLDSYDLKTGQWQRLPDAPRARDHFQAAVCNNRLYLIGGRRYSALSDVFGNTVAEVDVYDFNTASWRTLEAGIPTPRAGLCLAVVGDDILALQTLTLTALLSPPLAEFDAYSIAITTSPRGGRTR